MYLCFNGTLWLFLVHENWIVWAVGLSDDVVPWLEWMYEWMCVILERGRVERVAWSWITSLCMKWQDFNLLTWKRSYLVLLNWLVRIVWCSTILALVAIAVKFTGFWQSPLNEVTQMLHCCQRPTISAIIYSGLGRKTSIIPVNSLGRLSINPGMHIM